MKIAILDFLCSSLDVVTVTEEWLANDLRENLSVQYDDEEWNRMDDEERLELFLFDYCNYSSNIQYMVDFTENRNMTPEDFR